MRQAGPELCQPQCLTKLAQVKLSMKLNFLTRKNSKRQNTTLTKYKKTTYKSDNVQNDRMKKQKYA